MAEAKYPICIDGQRACPPEDCGGRSGYMTLLEAIRDPQHSRHNELVNWLGRLFDPEYFNPNKVVFHNPDVRLKKVLKYLS